MGMNPAEFANIRNAKKDFWWYRGMRSILFRMMEPCVAERGIGRALEVGCGTGYLSHLLQLASLPAREMGPHACCRRAGSW